MKRLNMEVVVALIKLGIPYPRKSDDLINKGRIDMSQKILELVYSLRHKLSRSHNLIMHSKYWYEALWLSVKTGPNSDIINNNIVNLSIIKFLSMINLSSQRINKYD